MLQSRKDSLREGNAGNGRECVPQSRKESLKDSSAPAPQFTSTSPPRRKDSDRLPSLPPQRDDGYEAIQIPQSSPKPKPTTPTEQSSSEYTMPPPRPHKPSELSSTADSTPQQTVPPVRPTGRSSSSVNAYETVEIVPRKPQAQQSSQGSDGAVGEPWSSHRPPRPPKPGSFIGSETDDSSSIYQAPPAPVSIKATRDDVYDNVHIKNTPLSMTGSQSASGSPPSLGTFTGGTSDSGIIPNDIKTPQEVKGNTSSATDTEATDGKLKDVHEIDSGGMGCKNIKTAMEERRQILKEKETKEGVVLLSVQKLNEKRSDLIATHGMCACCLETCATLHPHRLFIFMRWDLCGCPETLSIKGASASTYVVSRSHMSWLANVVLCSKMQSACLPFLNAFVTLSTNPYGALQYKRKVFISGFY